MSNYQISFERENHLIYCYFQSKTGNRKKLIGTINLTDRTLYKKITPQKHTFNVSDSIGIAYELLKLNEYDFIKIQSGFESYETTKKFFIQHSDFKRFSGYELQKFLPKNLFGMERAESWEREQKVIPVNAVSERYNRPAVFQMELF